MGALTDPSVLIEAELTRVRVRSRPTFNPQARALRSRLRRPLEGSGVGRDFD